VPTDVALVVRALRRVELRGHVTPYPRVVAESETLRAMQLSVSVMRGVLLGFVCSWHLSSPWTSGPWSVRYLLNPKDFRDPLVLHVDGDVPVCPLRPVVRHLNCLCAIVCVDPPTNQLGRSRYIRC